MRTECRRGEALRGDWPRRGRGVGTGHSGQAQARRTASARSLAGCEGAEARTRTRTRARVGDDGGFVALMRRRAQGTDDKTGGPTAFEWRTCPRKGRARLSCSCLKWMWLPCDEDEESMVRGRWALSAAGRGMGGAGSAARVRVGMRRGGRRGLSVSSDGERWAGASATAVGWGGSRLGGRGDGEDAGCWGGRYHRLSQTLRLSRGTRRSSYTRPGSD